MQTIYLFSYWSLVAIHRRKTSLIVMVNLGAFLIRLQKKYINTVYTFSTHFLAYLVTCQFALTTQMTAITRDGEGQHLLPQTASFCLCKSVLSAFFCIHNPTDAHDWLESVWLTGQRVSHPQMGVAIVRIQPRDLCTWEHYIVLGFRKWKIHTIFMSRIPFSLFIWF